MGPMRIKNLVINKEMARRCWPSIAVTDCPPETAVVHTPVAVLEEPAPAPSTQEDMTDIDWVGHAC